MRRHGTTSAGRMRWRCIHCGVTSIRTRKDPYVRGMRKLFQQWLIGTEALSDVAKKPRCSRMWLSKCFEQFWEEPIPPVPLYTISDHVLIMDGIYLSGRRNVALILRTLDRVRSWYFAERECFVAWDTCLSRVPPPTAVVTDGQKGLIEAIMRRFPQARIQRCLVHVERFLRMCLSCHPKTEAGQVLWILMRSVWQVRTHDDAARWIDSFHAWEIQYESFLKERSTSLESGRWWYTHRKVRAARTHIRNALPHLFTFIEIPGVPRTTNHVEGGVNSRLKELVRRHRGLSPERKRMMAALFLTLKTKKKATH